MGVEKKATWGNPLKTFVCLLKLVKLIKYKKELSGGNPCKIPVVIFSCTAFVVLSNEAKSG